MQKTRLRLDTMLFLLIFNTIFVILYFLQINSSSTWQLLNPKNSHFFQIDIFIPIIFPLSLKTVFALLFFLFLV